MGVSHPGLPTMQNDPINKPHSYVPAMTRESLLARRSSAMPLP